MNAVTQFPFEKTSEFPSQEDPREFVFEAIEGHSPARQKKLILDACACGFLNEQDTEMFLDACGLNEVQVT